jgi:putative nucleotidyltransferase with HDIG domain
LTRLSSSFRRIERGTRGAIVTYQLTLILLVALVLLSSWDTQQVSGQPWAILALAIAAAVGERARVFLGPNTEVSISLLPTVFAAAVFGATAGAVVAAASYIGDFPLLLPAGRRADAFRRGSPFLKWGIYTSIRCMYGATAGLAASAVSSAAFHSVEARLAVGTTVAALVAETLDQLFAALTLFLRGGQATDSLRASAPAMGASIPLYAPVVALLGIAYVEVSPWTLPLFLAPTLAAQRLFALYQQQRHLAEDLARVNTRLEQANLSFATALVATLDARDRYTAGHSAAVAIYARDIANRMGLTEEQQQLAHLCGLVHDIGKIGLPAGLLEKPGALTLDERRDMQRHSVIGERILANVATYIEIAAVVRHHHERVDGEGYPDGLVGDEIPLLSRIIAVADAYNAMTSDRPYRDAMPSRVARLRLAQAVESQFDTSVVAAFEALLAGADESYRLAQARGFEFAAQQVTGGDRSAELIASAR